MAEGKFELEFFFWVSFLADWPTPEKGCRENVVQSDKLKRCLA